MRQDNASKIEQVKYFLRLPIRGYRSATTRHATIFFAPCLFYFPVYRSRDNLLRQRDKNHATKGTPFPKCPFALEPICSSAHFPGAQFPLIGYSLYFPLIPISTNIHFFQVPIGPKSPFILRCPFAPVPISSGAHFPQMFICPKCPFTPNSLSQAAPLHTQVALLSSLTPPPFAQNLFVRDPIVWDPFVLVPICPGPICLKLNRPGPIFPEPIRPGAHLSETFLSGTHLSGAQLSRTHLS